MLSINSQHVVHVVCTVLPLISAMYDDYELTHDQNDVATHKEIQPLSTLIVVVMSESKWEICTLVFNHTFPEGTYDIMVILSWPVTNCLPLSH